MKKLYLAILVFFYSGFIFSTSINAQIIISVAGNGSAGFTGNGSAATTAEIEEAYAITTDHSGNFYTSGWNTNGHVRIINAFGVINTFAGNGSAGFSGDGGPATSASLNEPLGICSDAVGNIYICDLNNARIRKVNTSGIISTFAGIGTTGYTGDGGPATAAEIYPWGITSDGTNIYFSDYTDHRIRKINASGVITGFAGTGGSGSTGNGGPATAATLIDPEYLACDASGNVYISDWGTQNIRKIDASTGIITVFAGTGAAGYSGDGSAATGAAFHNPSGISVDGSGNVYVSDFYNYRVRKINTAGIISTIGGNGTFGFSGDTGPATAAQFSSPYGLSVDGGQNIFVCDYSNLRVRMIVGHNRTPYFTGGHNVSITVCENTISDSLNSILPIYDSDIYQQETWSLITAPSYGTAICVDTALSTSSTVAAHNMYYKPIAGYIGPDSFRVRIFDGQAADTTMVHVVVVAAPSIITGTVNVCLGAPSILSDSVSGGLWSSSSAIATIGSASGIYMGSTSGVDTIKYTLTSNGCFVTKAITVNPIPSAITGPFTVCAGASITLSSATTSGAWSCSGGGTSGTINPVTGVLTGIAPGSTIVTYILPTGCSVSTVVTVNASPSAIAFPGGATMCVGAGVTLTDPTTGGIWSGTTAYAIVGSTGGVSGIATGYSTVTYTIPSGCYATKQVTVNGLPAAITGLFSLCAGTTTTMYDAGGTWSVGSGGVLTIGSASGVVTGVSAGTATITYTLPTGCNAIASVTVEPIPGPITGRLATCVGDTATLRDSVAGGYWLSSDYSIANIDVTLGTVTGISGGIATITYMLLSGCSVTATETVNLTPGSISGTFSICQGATTTLYCTGGGTWTSSDITKATINSSTGLLTGIAAGTATITYTVAGGCFVTQTVNVIAPASTISGTLHVCVGGTTILTDGTTGGTWSCTPSATATISSGGTVSGVAAGLAVVSYSTGGCGSVAIVTVNPLPTAISGASTLCIGSATTLTDAGGTWSAAPLTTGSISAVGIVTGISTGTVTVVYTLPTGCAVSKTITVNALPAVISGFSSVCVGQTITETDAGGGTWSKSNADAIIGSTGIVTGVTAGTDIITYTLPTTGCYITKTVTVSTTAGAITGTPTVCVGATTTLTDGGAGTWSSGSGAITIGTSTGVVIGMSAGAATVTYSVGTGCTASTTITVNPLPITITGTGSICPGGSITLSSSTGGTWSSSTAAVNSATGVVTGTIAGTPIITYTLPTGCYRTATITVNPTPPLPGGPSALCVGAHINLIEGGAGTWLSGSTVVATIGATTGAVTGVATGTSNITFTSSAGCPVTTTITVSLSPTAITGPGTVCTGASVALTDTAGGGVWTSSSSSASIGSLSGVVTGASAGTVVITYSLGTGCTVTRTETVMAAPAAIHGTTTLCAGTTTTLTDASTGGTWSSTPATTATITSGGVVSGIAAGTATIDYTVAGCFASDTITVNATPAAIGGPATVCQGATATATDAVAGGAWTTTSSNITLGSAGSITGISAGTATITYAIGTCSVSRTITINPVALITGATGLCVGNTTTLSDAVTGGTWAVTPATIATISTTTGLVDGMAAGVAAITYTTSTGCATHYTVTVSSSPSTITGLLHVCIGGTTTLGNTAGGGTWTTTSSNITIGSSTGIVTGITAGAAPVTYSLGTGCTAATTVVINLPPAPITGTMYMCPGASTSLADATASGSWSAVSTRATVDSRGVVSGSSAGTATITYVPPTGCAITAEVTINPTPALIGGTPTVCAGLTTTLTDSSAGGVWSSSSTGATIDSATGIVTGMATGTAIVTYTLPTGCAIAASVYVTAAPVAITGPTAMCQGSVTLLSDASAGGTWSAAATGIITVSSAGLVTGLSVGTALVSYTIGGCAAVITVSVTSLPASVSGTAHLCVGITDTLTDAGGGVWASSNPLIATIGSASGAVTGIIPGTLSVSYSLGVGCTVNMPVTVNSSPASITGPDNICMGTSTTLHDATTGGTWSSSAPQATVTSAGVVSGILGGTAIISYTSPATGCYSAYPVGVIQVPAITGTHNICAWGDTVTVHDSLAGGIFTSTLVTVSDSGEVLAYGPGTATVTYTESHGCFATATLTVNPLPAEITGSGTICVGATDALADATAGGVWSAAPTVAGSISTAGVVTGVATGAVVVSYTTSLYGCSQSTTVSVDAAPASAGTITGSSNVCAGSSIVLFNTITGGAWSTTGGVATIGSSSGIVTATSAGTATISYTVSNHCGSIATTTTVTVNATVTPSIIISAAHDTLCAGDAASLSSAITNGGTTPQYQWSVNGATITGATSATYHYIPATGDAVTALLTSDAQCAVPASVTSNTVTMTVDPQLIPVVTITASPTGTVLTGATVTFTAAVSNGGLPTYQWMLNGTTITGATNATYAADNFNNGDTVWCVVTSHGACGGNSTTSDSHVVEVYNNVGVPISNIQRDIELLPNPNSGTFTIKGTIGATDKNIQLVVTDVLGQEVYHSVLTAQKGMVNAQVQLSKSVANGMYLVSLHTTGGIIVFHMVVEQ